MGILDTVLGSLFGSNSASPGMSSVLGDILGGGQAGAGQGYGQGGYQGGTQGAGNVQGTSGGLGSLISMFEGAGLGHVIQSWIGNGANSSGSPGDLQNVFGDQVPGMAQKAGMEQGDS